MAHQEKDNKQGYSCAVCGKSFSSEREQRDHSKKKHQDQARSDMSGQSHGAPRPYQPNR